MRRWSLIGLGALVAVVILVAATRPEKPGARLAVTGCRLDEGTIRAGVDPTAGRSSYPALYAEGSIENLDHDAHSFSIRVTAWDGRFVVATTRPVQALDLRPGEARSWSGSGLADTVHQLPERPRCTVSLAVDP